MSKKISYSDFSLDDIVLLDLFAGTGGFAKGLKDAGFKFKKHYFSEIDPNCIANYQYNFRNAEPLGSITNIRGFDLGKVDIITFGSPCQDFSLAGNRKGMGGKRSSFIKEAIRLVDECKPQLFFWENVKGAFSSNNGEDFWSIIKAFANLGNYNIEWQLLNTTWVLPQNRERIFLVGHLATSGGSFKGIFPFTETDCLRYKPETNFKKIHSNYRISLPLMASGTQTWTGDYIRSGTYRTHKDGNGFRQNHGDCAATIPARARKDGSGQGVIKIISKPHGFYKGNESEISPTIKSNSFEHNNFVSIKPVLTPGRIVKRQNGRRIKEDGDPAFTLGCQEQHGILLDDSEIRRFTEIECERLQGLPDNWTKFGLFKARNVDIKKRSDEIMIHNNEAYIVREIKPTNRYKMCGNAVTATIVTLIGIKYLNNNIDTVKP
ncbi:DNA cytosine methyltransferase [Pseudarcicella hirudinis]|nr:DNA (cytosine-5-)-methyltransferase [Pseudarcicella hirudinis]